MSVMPLEPHWPVRAIGSLGLGFSVVLVADVEPVWSGVAAAIAIGTLIFVSREFIRTLRARRDTGFGTERE
jgi:hypothetical protein